MKLWAYGRKRMRVWNISNFRVMVKKHAYVIALFFLSVLFFHGILSSARVLDNIHYINDMAFLSYNVKESVFKYGTLHLWTPYFYSGQPMMAIPESYLFDLNFLYVLLLRNIYLAMNLAVVSYFFLAGLGMYLLVMGLKKEPKIAFISALIYMFNGFMHSFILAGHLNILESYSLMPFVFLFAYKAVKGENWLANSVIAGLFFSLMVLAGGIIFFLYTGLLVGFLLAFNIPGKNFLKRALRIFLIGAVLLLTLFGIAAIKLLPSLEYTGLSNRAAGISYTEFLGQPVKLASFWNIFVSNIGFAGMSGAVGIMAFALLLMGLFSYRNKMVIFFLFLIILAILLASGSSLAEFFYKFVPGFGKMRHIERSLVFFVFSASILVAYGYANLDEKLGKLNTYKKYKNTFYFLIVILILLEMAFFRIPVTTKVIEAKDIQLLDYISNDKSYYRTLNLGLKDLIGHAGYNYYAQLGVQEVKGGGGIWVNDYIEYMAVALQYAPSKLFGMLNTKYIIADTELNIPNTRLVGKFKDCRECSVSNAFGPYLYENLELLPRAFVVNSSILVIGKDDAAKQLIYSLMLNKFNPENTVIIRGKEKINQHDIEFLRRFNAVILGPESISQDSFPILKAYADSGGILLPDVLNGKTGISNEEVENLFNKFNGNHSIVEIEKYENNKISLNLNGKNGFLVLSETYAYFPGWEAKSSAGKIEILKANNVVSSAYIDNMDSITFEYKPKSFKYGAWISSISFLALLLIFILRKLK